MNFEGKFQVLIQNLALWFRGGVKKIVLILVGVGLVLIFPFYFIGMGLSMIWNVLPFNPNYYDDKSYFVPKTVKENEQTISGTQVVELKNKSKELYVSVNNKGNPTIGYFPYIYELQVLDKEGKVLEQRTETTYILPGEIKYLIYNSKNINAEKMNIRRKNETQAVYYNEFSKRFKKPNLTITNKNFEVRTFTDIMYLYFTVKNEDTVGVKNLNLIYLVRDARESVVGIGELNPINELKAGGQQDFTVDYYQPFDREPRILEVLPFVNYLDSGNIVR